MKNAGRNIQHELSDLGGHIAGLTNSASRATLSPRCGLRSHADVCASEHVQQSVIGFRWLMPAVFREFRTTS